jgi:hypothetical protein
MEQIIIQFHKLKFHSGIILILLSGLLAPFASYSQVRHYDKPRIEYVIPIWDSAPHNAFTDICHYKGYWYCVFREGKSHLSGDGNGKIRIIYSQDTSNWQTACVIADPAYDLRDPKLTVTSNNRLMMHYLATRPGDSSKYEINRIIFSSNGLKWTKPKSMNLTNKTAWRVTWVNNRAYTVAYNNHTGCTLYRSKNGIRYKEVCKFLLKGLPNETTLLPLPDDKMMAIIRREDEPRALYIGKSDFPFTNWQFKEVLTFAGGPNLIMLPDTSIYATHRSYKSGKGRLWISKVTGENVKETLMLPSGGDCGYAGMYWFNNALWISYYSSQQGNQAKIYLAKIVFDSPIPIAAH